MIYIIIFLGIMAVAEIGTLVFNIRNSAAQKSIELLATQLQQERETYNEYRKQFEKDFIKQKDATNLWAKKYYELEILLKKYEHEGKENETGN